MKPALVFDLNGTLLDLSALDPVFEALFGDARVRRDWFSEVLKIALATTAIGAYAEFGSITRAALKIVEQRSQRSLSQEQWSDLLRRLRALPPFPDVEQGLEELQTRDFQLAVLTNSGLDAAKNALEEAGLNGCFSRVLSADSVKRLKPAAEPYQMAARELGRSIGSIMLVAAHSWDVAGALTAGCQACFINRAGQFLDEITPRPNLVASDL
ncbi:MAG: haloacid dehalogenase type II, partial [Acidobacteriales bacterium]|nr:haloacid dehalogenase type II [Terriglobales bacterium]